MSQVNPQPAAPKTPFPSPDGEHEVAALNDGTHVLIRPLRADDRVREQAFIRRLSAEARRCRFLGEIREASDSLMDSLMATDGVDKVAYIALVHDNGELREVGISRYATGADRTRCECAVTVADDWRHRGLAVVLMKHLIETARRNGFQSMYSIDLAENHEMEELARFLGFTRKADPDDATLVTHTLQLSVSHGRTADAMPDARPAPATGKAEVQPAYRDIAVALTETSADRAAIDAAIDLARVFGSRVDLLQLLLMPTPMVDSWSLVPDASFIEAYEVIRAEARTRADAWRAHLKQAHVQGEVHPLEALYLEPSSLAAQAARCRDLVMIAGPGAHDGDAASLRRYFASLLFETGLPVLVIPHGAEPVVPPRRAVVAWADTRECVRAIHDALPLLKGCEWVSVASVNDSHASEPAEVVALLKHHGVKAEPSLLKLSGDESTASRILEHAATSHAHIIVAGGYGHSRLREWAIGGVTRELLMHARIPVLFSH